MSTPEPVTIAMAFGIDADTIQNAGAVDVALNCDTNLFIDPLLLGDANNLTFRSCALAAYTAKFEVLIELLQRSKAIGDVAWRAAERQLSFHEVPYTHLGYSSGVSGSGFGKGLSGQLLTTAKEVIDLGVTSPDLFMVLALIEDGIGADRISDMTTNIVFDCLAAFSVETSEILGITIKDFKIAGRTYKLPPNPINEDEPLLFVPRDIVRDLPIASDWSSVGSAAHETQDIRDRVNSYIGEIWRAKTKKDKREIRDNALRSKRAFETLLEVIHNASGDPYDTKNDRRGEIYPANVRRSIATNNPLDLKKYAAKTLAVDDVDSVAQAIIDQFKSLIESKGLWKELWDDKHESARLEKAMQRLFYAVACAYCDANRLDISPESDAGSGPVDFKFSAGSDSKVLVEIKRSSNPKLAVAYTSQLDAYRAAEGAFRAHYVIIDIGGLTAAKMAALSAARADVFGAGLQPSEIVIIDGSPQKSASKR